jgi:hypothetical protein
MENYTDDNDCPICYERMYIWNDCRLICGHIYHAICISKWFDKDNSTACPLCRQSNDIDHISGLDQAIDNTLYKIIYIGYSIPNDCNKILELIFTKFYDYTHQYTALRIFLHSSDKYKLKPVIARRLIALSNKRYLKLVDNVWILY